MDVGRELWPLWSASLAKDAVVPFAQWMGQRKQIAAVTMRPLPHTLHGRGENVFGETEIDASLRSYRFGGVRVPAGRARSCC